ncbi:MAG: ATP-binding protein [Deltaproteobacteria bacterium]|nr:ATP-binding protein [Deltaproteobacteria bacterium]
MKTLEQSFSLHVPSSTQNLVMIREFIGRVGEQAGLADGDRNKLELAVDEACCNVIEHAYGNDARKEVTVRAHFDADLLRISVIDTGVGFEPSAVEQPELGELIRQRRHGGLGMRLIQKLMDEVRYEIEPGKKNELTMVKRVRPSE